MQGKLFMNADGVFVCINGSTVGCLIWSLFFMSEKKIDAFINSFSVEKNWPPINERQKFWLLILNK